MAFRATGIFAAVLCMLSAHSAQAQIDPPDEMTSDAEALMAQQARCVAGDLDDCALLSPNFMIPGDRDLLTEEEQREHGANCQTEAGAEACLRLGVSIVVLTSDLSEHQRARSYFHRSCELGSARGCEAMSTLLRRGAPEIIDLEVAAEFDEQACQQGRPGACMRLAADALLGDEPDMPTHFDYWERACNAGSGMSCGTAALAYQTGIGRDQDDNDAETWLERGCELEDGQSCFSLANHRARTARNQRQRNATFELVTRACDLEHGQACATAAHIILRGEDFARRMPEMMDYGLRACELGEESGCEIYDATAAIMGRPSRAELNEASSDDE